MIRRADSALSSIVVGGAHRRRLRRDSGEVIRAVVRGCLEIGVVVRAMRPLASKCGFLLVGMHVKRLDRPCEFLAFQNLAVHDAHLHLPMSDPVRNRILFGHTVRLAGVGARVLRSCDGNAIAIQKLRDVR